MANINDILEDIMGDEPLDQFMKSLDSPIQNLIKNKDINTSQIEKGLTGFKDFLNKQKLEKERLAQLQQNKNDLLAQQQQVNKDRVLPTGVGTISSIKSNTINNPAFKKPVMGNALDKIRNKKR